MIRTDIVQLQRAGSFSVSGHLSDTAAHLVPYTHFTSISFIPSSTYHFLLLSSSFFHPLRVTLHFGDFGPPLSWGGGQSID